MKALDYLIDWTNNISWRKHLLNTIVKNESADVEKLKKELLNIIENEYIIELNLKETESNNDNTTLRISSISNPQNINALSEESNFKLGKNLNVFYGENGTGKSSYVKVFRKLAKNYFTNEKNLNLYPNIYKSQGQTIEQTINITYEVNEIERSEVVNINNFNDSFHKINVFDSDSIVPLLNDDLSFSILPKGFNYFHSLIAILDNLKKSIDQDINSLILKKDSIFKDSSFNLITQELKYIQNTVHSDNIQPYLANNFPYNEDIKNELLQLEIQLKELTNNDVEITKKLLNAQKNKLLTINKSLSIVSEKLNIENISKVNILIDDFLTKVAEEKSHNEKFKLQISHLEKFNDEWLRFIQSGEKYYKSIGKSFPTEFEKCIFCGQILDETHVEKIEGYFIHINSNVLIEKQRLHKELLSKDIENLKLSFTNEDAELIGKEILVTKLKSIFTLINDNILLFSKSVIEREVIHLPNLVDFTSISNDIEKSITTIEEQLLKYNKSNNDTDLIKKRLNDRIEFIKKSIILHENLPFLEEWYVLSNKIESLEKVKRNFSTITVTKKAKEAFSTLIEKNYIQTFKQFCRELKVRDVDIKLKPQKGKTLRSKFVSNEKYKITDIMSEGEQKAIAMAEFATDIKIRKNYNTVIFDDPVTSLDYKRTANFANLIFNISKERQVVVFTHNILFYYFLYNQCESEKNKDNKFFKVDSYDFENKGLITESFSGRLDNISEIKKRINLYKEKIDNKKCFGDELEYSISLAYTEIRTWCELIVEEGFFKNIIRRYEPNIRFTSITNIDGSFINELENVSDLFSRACRWMIGHSQPIETLYSKPDREDFIRDLEYVKKITNQYTDVKWK